MIKLTIIWWIIIFIICRSIFWCWLATNLNAGSLHPVEPVWLRTTLSHRSIMFKWDSRPRHSTEAIVIHSTEKVTRYLIFNMWRHTFIIMLSDFTFVLWIKTPICSFVRTKTLNRLKLERRKGLSIKDVRTKGERGVCQMRTQLLIFAFKRAKYVDRGGLKTVKFCRPLSWMAP